MGRKSIMIKVLTIVGLILFFVWQSNHIVVSKYIYKNSKIPGSFDGFTIVQISDLHNKDFKGKLAERIENIAPDIIVITGDLMDRRTPKVKVIKKLIQEIGSVSPIYYVTGNHEQLTAKYEVLEKELLKHNVKIIDNSYIELQKEDSKIGLMGLADPAAEQSEKTYLWNDGKDYVKNNLSKLLENVDTKFNILLYHRPEEIHIYMGMNVDLVFSGHAHGGQIRIPFIGGVVAPNQGLFPKYTGGIYTDGSTTMLVSRGLGNSIFHLRIFNRPELVVLTLRSLN